MIISFIFKYFICNLYWFIPITTLSVIFGINIWLLFIIASILSFIADSNPVFAGIYELVLLISTLIIALFHLDMKASIYFIIYFVVHYIIKIIILKSRPKSIEDFSKRR